MSLGNGILFIYRFYILSDIFKFLYIIKNYSLQVISQDGDPNAVPTNINMSSVNRPDKVAPHGIGEFRGYHHI